ncbi:right-handed parallel beta-helix repeat-containing protein [Treponema maltophilum]
MTACKQFTADIDEELGYWAAEVVPVDYSFDVSYQMSNDGALCIPSDSPVTLTIKLHNSRKFSLIMPTSTSSAADVQKIIRFPGLSTQPTYGTDYTLEQTPDKSALRLKYGSTFLKAHEWSNGNIGAEITLTSTDGRKFGKKFSLNIEANTPPPEIGDITIAKTKNDGMYVLHCKAGGMAVPFDSTTLLHKDIAYLNVQKEGGTEIKIPISALASQFDTSHGGPVLLQSTEVDPLIDTIPSGNWELYVKTGTSLTESTLPQKYTVRLIDRKGLSSAPKEAHTLGYISDLSSAGTAWKNLKEAVESAEAGGVITVMGEVKATNDTDNYGTINVTKSLTIKGAGSNPVLDANQSALALSAHRIFTVTGDKTELTLENLTLKNGYANKFSPNETGGAIDGAGIKTLTLKHCTIKDCTAYGGGGIFLNGGVKATLTDCTITGCETTADPGGAIYAGSGSNGQPVVYIKGGSISSNTGYITGGAINITRGSLYINTDENGDPDTMSTTTEIKNNTVIASGGGGNEGGGISCYWEADKPGKLTIENAEITNCNIEYNSSGDKNAHGAGIHVYGSGEVSLSNVTLNQCGFTGETPGNEFNQKQGGGIYLREVSTATIKDCTFTQCKAKHGGAFHIEGDEKGNATVSNCTFTQNEAEEYGGALCIDGDAYTVSITDSTIGGVLPQNGNKVTDPSVQYGGGICVFHGLCIVKNVTIQNNTAHKGSGIYLNGKNASGGGLTIDGKATIKDNHLMISYQDTTSNFITVKDLDAATYIDIQPENYADQINKPLVKAAGTKPNNWETLFNLVVMPPGQTWELKKNDAGTELILKKTS